MRRYVAVSVGIFLASVLAIPSSTFAHPGRTAGDGCHYCRTNCSKWGEAWDERHCHNDYTAPAPAAAKPKAIYIDPCSHTGLLNTYKAKKAAGEVMSGLSAKSWWVACPASVRQSVYKAVSK